MAEDTFLTDDLLRQLISVGEVDLLVGVSAHNPANPVRPALQTIEQTCRDHFLRQRVAIVLFDGQSQNEDSVLPTAPENPEQKRERTHGLTSLRTVHRVVANFPGPPSPGVALRTTLAIADLVRARACAVFSANSTNITSDSIANLLTPVYQDKFDFAAPLYTRHKFQGLLMRNLLYPMSRALFGCGMHEVFPAEWSFSGRFASYCLNQDVWHEEAIRAQPEAWMAITASATDHRCCQVVVGKKGQLVGVPDIVEVLRQTVGALFWCLEKDQAFWLDHDHGQSIPTFGTVHELTSEPTEMDSHRIFEMFRTGVTDLEPVLSTILDPETHAEIKGMTAVEEGKFRFKPDVWVRTLYDFAASYHHAVITRDHLVQALAPLYRGMTHSFLVEHADSSPAEIEAANEMLCAEFELQKTYLRERWKTKTKMEVKS